MIWEGGLLETSIFDFILLLYRLLFLAGKLVLMCIVEDYEGSVTVFGFNIEDVFKFGAETYSN